jgi:hypothetical protein
MTDDDDITVVPMKELARLRRIEAAARALLKAHDWRNNSEAEELLLIALDPTLLGEPKIPVSAWPRNLSWRHGKVATDA